MDQTQADAFAAEWIEAWNAHDLDRILTHYADEVEFVSPLIQRLTGDAAGRLVGKAAVREYFAKGLATYPELEFKLIRALPGVGGVALHYRSVNGLLAAEVMELDEQGRVRRATVHYASA